MNNPLKEIKTRLFASDIKTKKDRDYVLPEPSQEAARYSRFNFKALQPIEVEKTLEIILKNVAVTREFGLYIDRNDLDKEEDFFLMSLDAAGSPKHIRETFEKHIFSKFLHDSMEETFASACQKYFDETPPDEVKNRYHCHLLATVSDVITRIYYHDYVNDPVVVPKYRLWG